MPEGEKPALGATMPCPGFGLPDIVTHEPSTTLSFPSTSQHDIFPPEHTTRWNVGQPFTISRSPSEIHALAAGDCICATLHPKYPSPPLGFAIAGPAEAQAARIATVPAKRPAAAQITRLCI